MTSCNKDDDLPQKPEPGCRIITRSSGTDYYNFEYNEEGKLSTITNSENYTTNFTYSGDTIFAVKTKANTTDYEKSIIINNEAGYASYVRIESDKSGNNWLEINYLYDNDNQLLKTSRIYSGGTTFISTLQWENGNPKSINFISPNVSYTVNYEYYNDKLSQEGIGIQTQELTAGYKTISAHNLLKSSAYPNDTINYNYEFDSEGKVIMMASTSTIDSATTRTNFQYLCK